MKSRYIDFALLLLRVGIGLSVAFFHGYDKIAGGPEKWEKIGGAMADVGITFLPVFWGFMAAFAEFFGGILVALGFFTRAAAFLVAVTMLMAFYGHLHGGDSFAKGSHAFELMCVFIAILLTGAGKYSVDHYIRLSKFLQ